MFLKSNVLFKKVSMRKDIKVLVVGGSKLYDTMFLTMGCQVKHISNKYEANIVDYEDLDVICFTGGADVHPKMYDHTVHHKTFYNLNDDEFYDTVWERAQKHNPEIKFVGICRGSQYLCVKAGGTLIQDCQGHAVGRGHFVDTILPKGKSPYVVTSTHHQMQYPVGVEHELVAWVDNLAVNPVQHIDNRVHHMELEHDYEVVWYPKIEALAFQPHPEFMIGSCRDLFILAFDKYILGEDVDNYNNY